MTTTVAPNRLIYCIPRTLCLHYVNALPVYSAHPQKMHENKKSTFLTETNNADSNRLLTHNPSAQHHPPTDLAVVSSPYNGSGGSAFFADSTTTTTTAVNMSTYGDNNDDNLLENDVELSLKKRMYALRELITTEESYVQDLALIVDGYIREIRDPDSDIVMPDDLKGGKERMIFGNVEAIYEWHRE